MPDCIFCDIGRGQTDSELLFSDDRCFVIRDIAPKAPVHLLVIPNEHFTFLEDLTPDHYPMLGRLFQVAEQSASKEGLSGSGYRLVINQGSDAGQQVDHLHLHVLGGEFLGDMV